MIAMNLAQAAAAIEATADATLTDGSVTGVSIDSRTTRPGDLFFAIRGERFDGHDFIEQAASAGSVGCVVSQPDATASVPCLRVDDPAAALLRLAAHQRAKLQATVIAVTGSNGKTTTKRMIDCVLGSRLRGRAAVKSYNNSLGVPLTLLSACPDDQYLVVEIGSSSPGEVRALAALAAPRVGVVTSIGNAHLEGLGGIEGVAREKLSLLGQLEPGGVGVVNLDHPAARAEFARYNGVGSVTYGLSDAADLRLTDLSGDLDQVRWRLDHRLELHLEVCGTHNALNATAAYAVARWMGFTDDQIATALTSFRPADMRLNVKRCGPVTVIDDSYNANPSNLAVAIDLLAGVADRRRVLVVGDMLELGDEAASWHTRLGRRAAQAGIDLLVAAGRYAPDVAAGAGESASRTQALVYEDAGRVCAALGDWIEPGDVVLVKGSRATGMERVVQALGQLACAGAPVG